MKLIICVYIRHTPCCTDPTTSEQSRAELRKAEWCVVSVRELKMGIKNISVFLSFPFLFLLTFISFHAQTKADENRVYIVYMGSAASSSPRSKNSLRNDHAHLLKSVLRRSVPLPYKTMYNLFMYNTVTSNEIKENQEHQPFRLSY